MTKQQVPVSVIINTADRAKYLGETLEGLKQQTYDNFEVILVNGPSEDNTEEVAKSYNVRYYTAPFNLSVSRNIGVKAAAGEILLFIDDDAVPTRTWIEEIVKAYEDPAVGAAGGFVYHTGNAHYQFCYGAIDMWGKPVVEMEPTKPFNYNTPHAEMYNINIGTNASYRRTYLVEVGGFDEEYEYYHDESDVCVRMIDGGYKVVELENALVHHKMAPSSRRKSWKSVVNWNSMMKNGIYFALKHTKGKAGFTKRLFVPGWNERHKFKDTAKALKRGDVNIFQFIYKVFGLWNSMFKGYSRGYFQKQKLLSDYVFDSGAFKTFKEDKGHGNKYAKKIVLVSQGFPPNATDGIARYNHTLAKQLVAEGHHVSVVTKSLDGRDQTVYEDGYWLYYHDSAKYTSQVTGYERVDNIISHTKSVYNTVKAISESEGIDAIITPLWDVEGLALIREKIAPTYVTLMSPLKKVVETQWFSLKDPSINYVYELEKYVIENADGIMAISQAVADTIANDYGVDWASLESPLRVIPLGVESNIALVDGKASKGNKKKGEVELLYVGRFERRKGIDVLLGAIPALLKEYPYLSLRLIGNSDVYDPLGVNFWEEFKKKHKSDEWFSRIRKDGYVTDKELADAYAQCDIFVAPSRYESFGLIFIEAMSHGKPVVGSRVGGIPETVEDGVTGLLFESGDSAGLEKVLSQLIESNKLREKLGMAGLESIQKKFNAKRMTKGLFELLDK